MLDKATIFKNTILRGVVGSTALGTAISGTDDRDEMGICIEPMTHIAGLDTFEHYIQRDQPEGIRSQPGDLDLTIYGLKKYCKLAAKGNPSVLVLLWLPRYEVLTEIGKQLIGIRKAFFSTESGQRFLGYLLSQRAALIGERAPKVQRPELVEEFGYDTKFAMHALRLGYQGIHMLLDEEIVLPIPDREREYLLNVRKGLVSKEEVIKRIDDRVTCLKGLINDRLMLVDKAAINNFMKTAYESFWFSGKL